MPVDLPEIPGISADPQEILSRMLSQYESAYFEQTGSPITLATGDPIRIWLYTIALQQYLLENQIKYYASQNLIGYAEGAWLDNISATRGGPARAQAKPAVVTMEFTFSQPLAQPEIIPAGTRVTARGRVYFSTNEPYTLDPGIVEWSQVFTCETAGEVGNGFLPGQIATLVDPLPYVQSVINTDTSQGGADVESDDHYAELIYLSPEGYSVAGPELAYEYIAKSFSSNISDVKVYRADPGQVNVIPLLQNGQIPEAAFLTELLEFLSAKDKRPLTDYVTTAPPTVISYDIAFTYYIEAQNSTSASEIQTAVLQAVDEYVLWQKSKIGRDINPQELIRRVIEAGAKRLEVTLPTFTPIDTYGIAVAGSQTVNYGGLEDA